MQPNPKNNDVNIEIEEGGFLKETSLIQSVGFNNTIFIGKNSKVGSLGTPKIQFMGSNNRLIFESGSVLKRGHIRFVGDNQVIVIGKKTTINGIYMLCDEGCSIRIGDDCLLSYDIEMRTTDAHSIIDLDTGARLNPAGDISIGDRVWIGKEVMLTKGVVIASEVVIGARALVTKSLSDNNVAIAGVPAKIVKRNITWDRRKL